jgi:hypothetical protein
MITHFDMASCAMIVEPGETAASVLLQPTAAMPVEARLQSVAETLAFEHIAAASLPADLATVSASEFIDTQR